MFGRDYRVPMDILYGVHRESSNFQSIMQYERTLQDLYYVARESMEVRQSKFATYYDKKIRDDELVEGQSVYVCASQ